MLSLPAYPADQKSSANRGPVGTGRRLREAAYRVDNPIELEGPQGAGLHDVRVCGW